MPTISQLVRKGRQSKTTKSKSPYLGLGYNSIKKRHTNYDSPQKRGVCVRLLQWHLETKLCIKKICTC